MTIPKPDDWHYHPRNGVMCQLVVPYTARVFARGLGMPNLPNELALVTGPQAIRHKAYVESYADKCWGFEHIPTIMLTDDTTVEDIREAHQLDIRVVKQYFSGTTNNSFRGITLSKLHSRYPIYDAMSELGMILSGHWEHPDSPILEGERDVLPILRRIRKRYPDLKIVFEHVSTREGVSLVYETEKMVATITSHHMVRTTNDVFGKPHNLCRPIFQPKIDQQSLIEAATNGNSKFFFGSDSAPHWKSQKECAEAKYGIFVPGEVAMGILADVFVREGKSERLANFTSGFGADFYGFPRNTETMTLVKEPLKVPERIVPTYSDDCVVPFMAGETLNWRIAPSSPDV